MTTNYRIANYRTTNYRIGNYRIGNYRIGKCSIQVDPDQETVVTTFPDGIKLEATPVRDKVNLERALELGYDGEDPVWSMTADHDLCHTLLAAIQGLSWSPTLFAASHDYFHVTEQDAHREECMVFLIQRLLMQGRGVLRRFET